MTPLPISASDIRARIARGEDVSAMLPPPVLGYIREKGLYL
jgi:nicotinate-nucleotide adenylyltransferase